MDGAAYEALVDDIEVDGADWVVNYILDHPAEVLAVMAEAGVVERWLEGCYCEAEDDPAFCVCPGAPEWAYRLVNP